MMTDGKMGGAKGTLLCAICLAPGTLLFFADTPLLPSVLLFFNLWILALYDCISFRLPNLLTATLFVTGSMVVAMTPGLVVWTHVIGAFAGLVFFPVVNVVYKQIRGRDGIGLGDAKLMAGIGMWLGWPLLPPVLLVASLAGLLYGGGMAVVSRRSIATTRIPFGPFLCLGAWLAWLFLS